MFNVGMAPPNKKYPDPVMGQRFGRWRVAGWTFSNLGGPRRTSCLCDCGRTGAPQTTALYTGLSASCGRHKESLRKPGPKDHALYGVWHGMRQRCGDSGHRGYKDYGGRGIAVDSRWLEYGPFYEWAMSNGWAPGLAIDRADNSLGYSPENCRFVTPTVNARNKRNNVKMTAWGETKCASEWSLDSRCRAKYDTMLFRVRHAGWAHERAISQPVRRRAV